MSGALSRGSSDVQLEGRGRVRRCKHCKFSCTDAKEFFHHQMMEHDEVNDQVYATPIKGLPKLIRKQTSVTSQEENITDDTSDKANGDTIIINNIPDDDDDEADDDGRLIIADETEDGSNSESTVTPTRSGNIQNRTYVCGVCDFSSNSAKVYLTHQQEKHNFDIIIYECDICDYATKYKQKLPRHRKLHFSGQEFLGEGMPGEMDEFSGNGYNDALDNLREDDDMPQETYKDLPPLIDSNTVIVHPTAPEDSINLSTAGNTPSTEKKTKKRQEVDPAKYFEVVDDTGCKYACSSCGNVYKWRKSLNKHWKEKHGGELPDNSRKPPGLMYLVNSGGHTICGRRKILANSVLNKSQNGSLLDTSGASSAPGTPMSSSMAAAVELMMSMPEYTRAVASPLTTAIPSFIGPFVTNSLQPVFPETSTPNMQRTKQLLKGKEGQLGNKIRIQGQNEPLDFSVRKDDEALMQSSYMNIKSEPDWEQKDGDGTKDDKYKSLQCNKCSFVGKTVADYSAHMSLHLSRRAYKCNECQENFNGVDELNSHFADLHANRIQEHKEAIQRIPHGLQQTYHLLKMPLNAITTLNSQDLTNTAPVEGTNGNKKLKCNMCSFVAKWPAELQKHAVSHSEERPFSCMVCGSTYKWKWDLVKHFEKSHHSLPNPYKRRDLNMSKNGSSPSMASNKSNMSLDEESLMLRQGIEDPPSKRRRLSDSGVADRYEEMDEEDSKNSLSHLSNLNIDVNGLANIGRSMGMACERPSSLPRYSDMDDDEMATLIQEREHILASRPINETTQKAIAAAVLNRLNNPQASKDQQMNDMCSDDSSVILPYKCHRCEYRARWPSEITQHMKNHSEDKPYHCPRCSYKSKWKWDVVKHLKRCGGGGTIRDVIDTTKIRKTAPPNVMVMPEGRLQQQTPQQSFRYQQMAESLNESALASMAKMTMDKRDTEKAMKEGINSRKPVFRSLINEGLYHCLECQFVGTSPAELKRHAVLHSENKPFTCEVCGYGSRWKCDLKKHMRTYNHYTSAAQMMESQNDTGNSDAEDSENNYQCNKCYFSTDQQHLFKAHLQVHESKSGNVGRFKCKQCSFQVNDLASFLQHRVTHTSNNSGNSSPAPSQNSPAASQTSESPKTDMDEARLKHPRKPVKTFQCFKCDFVCKSKDLLETHELDHEEDDQQFKCVYCEESFKDKDSLLDHISTHSDFNPDEWEVFFMDEEVEENNNEPMDSLEQFKKSENISSSDTPRLASALAAGPQYLNKQSESNNQPQKISGGIIVPASRKFTCEWCDATFAHVTTLYHHGKNVHPIELNSQEMAETARDYGNQMKNMGVDIKQLNQYTGGNPYLLNPALMTSQVLSHVASVNKERPILPNNMDPMKFRKNISPQKKAKSFQCTKCPFTAPNAVTYLRHIERHGSNCKHTCWFCDYSIDRLNLLYQHMKGTHTDQWRKTATTGDVSPKPDSRDYSSSYGSDDNESTTTAGLQIKEELMLKGVPVQICTYNGRRVFKCKKCSYISTNAANTTNHARQHNPMALNEDKPETVQAMNNIVKALRAQKEKKKSGPIHCGKCPFKAVMQEDLDKHLSCHGYNGMYRCKQCDFSTDVVMMLTQHMQLHENNQPMEPKSPSKSTFNKLVLNRKAPVKDKLLTIQARTSLNKSRRIRYRCSRCPYNSFCKDNMVKHRKQHVAKSRFRCPLCNYSATRDYLLFQHMKFHGGDTDKLIQQFKDKNLKTDGLVDPFEAENKSPESNTRTENEDMEIGDLKSCKGCPFTCETNEDLEKHIKLHFTENQYKCDYCSLTEESLSPLLQHRLLHSKEEGFNDNPPVSNLMNTSADETQAVSSTNQDSPQESKEEMKHICSICPYKCNSLKSYTVHKSMHGSSKKFICDYCNWSVDRLNLLYQHRRVHCNEDGYDSSPEELVFMNREYALGSTTNEDEVDEFELEKLYGKETSYSCTDCPFKTANHNSFINHRAFHKNSARHQCTECSYSVDKWTLMCQHQKLHEVSDSSTSPSKMRLKCTENLIKAHDQEQSHNKSTNIKSSSISPHSSNIQVIEPGTSKITCPQLYFSSTNDEVLSDQSEEEFKCNRCPFSTTTKTLLAEHEHRHNFKSSVSCPYCDFSCTTEPDILEHIQVHFPGTPMDALKLMLERREKEPNNDSEVDKKALKVTLKTVDSASEPDSTVSESQKSQQSVDRSDEKNDVGLEVDDVEKPTTKIYVCQYCEREFDIKSDMITHERQHTIGQS